MKFVTENRKNNNKQKRDQDIDELFKKISDTEKENIRLRQSIFEIKLNYDKEIKSLIETIEKKSVEQETKFKEIDDNYTKEKLENNKNQLYIKELQNEIMKLKEENIHNLNEKDKLSLEYEQLKIDIDKVRLEKIKYNENEPLSARRSSYNTNSKIINVKL